MSSSVVDVVVATNRCSPFLSAALSSVVRQSYPHWTITVVDDGVPDASFVEEAVARVPNVHTVRHSPRGVSESRNVGAAVGSGALVAFLDDDDVWAPIKLEAQVAALNKAPDSVGCFTGGWYMDAADVPFGSGWPAWPATTGDFLRGAVPLPRIVTLVVRRDRFDAVGGFNPAYALCEDHDLMYRLLQQGPMVPVDGQLVGYRRHSGNVSSVDDLDGCTAGITMFRKLVAVAEQRGDTLTASLLRKNLAAFRLQTGRTAARRIAAAARNRDLASLRQATAVGVAIAPGQTVTAAAAAVGRRVRRRCRPPS